MQTTSRELVYQSLEFRNPYRAPRQLWVLPWANINYPDELKNINEEFPADIDHVQGFLKKPPQTKGDQYVVGEYLDEWGCKFTNAQEGIIGEVKEPMINDWDTDADKVKFPIGWLTISPDKINEYCEKSDKFIIAGCCPRPFERLQFLRGTENLYLDLLDPSPAMLKFIDSMHNFYCELLTLWAKTNVDALMFIDDWGAQKSLLISLNSWRQYFMPLYRDYINIAHSHNKKIFMHSDGNILLIYPELIGLGLDAINSQLFCMGIENLKPFAGKITFWGEIDRQYLLPYGSADEIQAGVQKIYDNLWKNGGCIAQCEFSIGGKPKNVYKVYSAWDEISSGNRKQR